MKTAYFLFYMLKCPSFLTQAFLNNNKAQDNIFKHKCEFGSWEDQRSRRRSISSYIDVENNKYQYRLLVGFWHFAWDHIKNLKSEGYQGGAWLSFQVIFF